MTDNKRSPKVFVPQEPHRYDPVVGSSVPLHNISPAAAYGEIVVCLPPNISFHYIGPVIEALRKNMQSIQPGDYLLAIGSPRVIAISAALASKLTGGDFKFLEWDKRLGSYVATEIKGV